MYNKIKFLFFVVSLLPLTSSVVDFDTFVAKYEDCNLIATSNEAFRHITIKYGSEDVINLAQLLNFLNGFSVSHEFPSTNFSTRYLNCDTLNLLNSKHQDMLINGSMFYEMCPTLVNLIDIYNQGSNIKDLEEEEPSGTSISEHPSRNLVWGFGFLAVTIISLCSLVGISFLPLMKTKKYNLILLYLITLAVGTLCSNALFQLIPEGFGIQSDPMTVWRSAVIFGGFYFFYLVENILERIFNQSHNHNNSGDDSEMTHSQRPKCEKDDSNTISNNKKDLSLSSDESAFLKWNDKHPEDSQKTLLSVSSVSVTDATQSSSDKICADATFHPASEVAVKQKQWWIFRNYKTIKTVAWMITIADGIHNFIDGLAIGASFSTSIVHGVSTSLAIFCEEFPHELGDFAILISSGMSVRQAAFYNFASACCCYFGLIVGILVGDNVSSAQWIFALAGGVFLYISLTGMLPEAQVHCSGKELRKSPWKCLIIKHLGLLSGFLIMFLLTLYKDKIAL